MTHALSNPYEIIINGVTCRASPYGYGQIIIPDDLERLGDKEEQFVRDLEEFYETAKTVNPKTKLLESITVYGLKKIEEGTTNEEKENGEQVRDTHQGVTQGLIDEGSRQKGSDDIGSEKKAEALLRAVNEGSGQKPIILMLFFR